MEDITREVAEKDGLMTVEEAVLQMNLVGHTFFAFKNADADGAFSVVYTRNGGGYGLIETQD